MDLLSDNGALGSGLIFRWAYNSGNLDDIMFLTLRYTVLLPVT